MISPYQRHLRPFSTRKSRRLPCLCLEPLFSYPVQLALMRKFKPMTSEIWLIIIEIQVKEARQCQKHLKNVPVLEPEFHGAVLALPQLPGI